MALVARRESFGGIIGDSDGYGFHVVNREGLKLLRRLADDGVDAVRANCDPPQAASVDTFLRRTEELRWYDGSGRLRCRFLDNSNDVPHLSAPIRVWLEVTSRCNLACAQCINEVHPDYLTPDLPLAAVLRLLEDLQKAAVIQITITGGEPLVRKDIFSILDSIVERRFGLRFFTNGTSLTDRNAERLGRYPISHLFLSLDGLGTTNDALRGGGTFARIARGLRVLANKIRNITLSTTLHRSSLTDIDALFQLAHAHGVSSILIRPLFQYFGRQAPMFIPAGELETFLDALESASAKYGVEYQMNKLPFRPLKKSVYIHDRPSDVHFSYFSRHNTFGCVGGNSVVGIKANGVIMACGFLPHKYATAGNSVLERPFLELWNSSENVTILRDLVGNPTCRSCTLLRLCGGGCRANALLHTKDLNAVDPYCFWRDKWPADLVPAPEPRQYADGPEPYLSDRAIITKCGSGSDL